MKLCHRCPGVVHGRETDHLHPKIRSFEVLTHQLDGFESSKCISFLPTDLQGGEGPVDKGSSGAELGK